MNTPTRRTLLKSSLALAATTALPTFAQTTPAPTSQPDKRLHGLKLGVATYTFRQKPLDPTIDSIKKVGLAYCSIKDFHLPLKSTPEQRKEVSDKFRAAGITPLSCGNITIRTEADAKQAFDYARDANLPTIVCAPTHAILPTLDKLVKEYDIKIAIHNHGPEDKNFPSPYDVWEKVKDLDPRVGLCVDVGHTARAGVDPAESIRKCAPRVYDCHLKDLISTDPKAKVIEIGRGVLDIRSILQSLLAINFQGHVGFEHEKDMSEPLPGLAESVGYVRGILSTLP